MEILRGKAVKITGILIALTIVFSLCLCGYNSYNYSKIGEYFAAENYNLALHYTENLPEGYKDVRKIRNFISLMQNFDKTDSRDYERAIAKLDELRGFENEEVNYRYNKFYISIISAQKDAEISEKTAALEQKIQAEAKSNKTEEKTTAVINDESKVFYLQNSEVYHLYRDCITLTNSKNVLTGEIPEERRVCKVCEQR